MPVTVIQMPNLENVSKEYLSCSEYIEQMKPMDKGSYRRQKQNYRLKEEIVNLLKEFEDEYVIVAVFADWCGDARRAIPVLALLEEKTNFEIRAFGGMTKPPRGAGGFWAVPPSPVEVDTFEITSSPTILIFEKETQEEIGRIKTRPKMTPTLEEEILMIINDYSSD
ncbi:MAG: hypothetical protein GF411_03375 [Candidatus Lokiarchaeota archaeon]|nr:hypothetical protein [Candidatus Lokiarchaeota archaeon]